jgi:hypothetical protein
VEDVVVLVVVVVLGGWPRSTRFNESPMVPGTSPRETISSWPNAPWVLIPQHFKSPLSNTAQEAASSIAMETATIPEPRSMSGGSVEDTPLSRLILSSSPNSPFSFMPQHFTLPAPLWAHVRVKEADKLSGSQPTGRSTVGAFFGDATISLSPVSGILIPKGDASFAGKP